MPTVSEFYGIVIKMFWRDHNPPHFHAAYGTDSMLIEIRTGRVIHGKLKKRAMNLVEEWRAQNVEKLLANWQGAREYSPIERIPPLD